MERAMKFRKATRPGSSSRASIVCMPPTCSTREAAGKEPFAMSILVALYFSGAAPARHGDRLLAQFRV